MIYTSIGGFVSVVRTDALQGVLMMIGAVLIFYFVTSAAGGIGAIADLSVMPDKQFLFEINGGIPFVVLLGISLSGSLKLIVDPRQTSRFFALKDEAALRSGMWVAIAGLTVVQLCLYPIGVYAHLLINGVTDTDLIVPSLVSNAAIFPLWAGDFLFVAIVAAAMSSMDSVLLVAASTGYKNLALLALPGGRSDPRRQVQWTRLMVVVLAAVAAGLALEPPGDILQITIFSGSLYAVCFLPAVVLGLYWTRGSSTAVLASMAAGVTILLIWLGLGFNAVLHEVFPALVASIMVYIVCALASAQRADLDQMLSNS